MRMGRKSGPCTRTLQTSPVYHLGTRPCPFIGPELQGCCNSSIFKPKKWANNSRIPRQWNLVSDGPDWQLNLRT